MRVAESNYVSAAGSPRDTAKINDEKIVDEKIVKEKTSEQDETKATPKTRSSWKIASLIVPLVAVGMFYLMRASGDLSREVVFAHGALCASAVAIKLAGSIDDAVWLMPFFCGTPQAKFKSACVYVGLFVVETCCCSVVTRILAFLLGFVLPQTAIEAGWDVPCVMQVLSGMALGFYGYKLLKEWLAGEEDEDDGDDAGDSPRGVKQLIVIGILGSLDDMCIQASLLSSGAFMVGHLLVGVFFGCIIVVSICWGASTLSFVLKAMEKVPLWCIVSCLAVYTFASALLGW